MNNNEIFAQGVKIGLKVALWVGGVLTGINLLLFGVHLYYIKKSYESPTNEVNAQLEGEFGNNANHIEVNNGEDKN